MKKSVLAIVVMVLSPLGAFAQSADTNYCKALSALCDKYVNNPIGAGRGDKQANPNIARAQSQCASNPGAAIPVLEQALTAARISLPAR